MSDPIHVSLPAFHQARLATLAAELLKAEHAVALERARRDELLSSVVGMEHDANALAGEGWTAAVVGSEVVLTPPVAQTPQLVPDIGPSGVSEAAAAG